MKEDEVRTRDEEEVGTREREVRNHEGGGGKSQG